MVQSRRPYVKRSPYPEHWQSALHRHCLGLQSSVQNGLTVGGTREARSRVPQQLITDHPALRSRRRSRTRPRCGRYPRCRCRSSRCSRRSRCCCGRSSRCTWAGRRRRGRTASLQDVALSARGGAARAAAEVLIKVGIIFLHARGRIAVAKSHCAIDHIEVCLPLIQPQLVINWRAGVAVIDGAPFDVEDTIRRTACGRGENTAGSAREAGTAGLCIRTLVIPVRQDGVVVGEPWQANVYPIDICGHELGIAVGRHIDAVKGLVIQRITERQTDKRSAVIGVIPDVRRTWLDTATDLGYVVMI